MFTIVAGIEIAPVDTGGVIVIPLLTVVKVKSEGLAIAYLTPISTYAPDKFIAELFLEKVIELIPSQVSPEM
jgi:hypothetical protein